MQPYIDFLLSSHRACLLCLPPLHSAVDSATLLTTDIDTASIANQHPIKPQEMLFPTRILLYQMVNCSCRQQTTAKLRGCSCSVASGSRVLFGVKDLISRLDACSANNDQSQDSRTPTVSSKSITPTMNSSLPSPASLPSAQLEW